MVVVKRLRYTRRVTFAESLRRLLFHLPSRDGPDSDLPSVAPPKVEGDALGPVVVGLREDLAPFLDELDVYLLGWGMSHFNAWELVRLPKTTPVVGAIPPRVLWPNMGRLLRDVVEPARAALGIPFTVRGYRPADYNASVGGAKRSGHVDFSALDIYCDDPRALALWLARHWDAHGKRLGIGLGVYGGHLHVDVGRRSRSQWANTMRYVRETRRSAAA